MTDRSKLGCACPTGGLVGEQSDTIISRHCVPMQHGTCRWGTGKHIPRVFRRAVNDVVIGQDLCNDAGVN